MFLVVDDLENARQNSTLTLIIQKSTISLAIVDHYIGEARLHRLVCDEFQELLEFMLFLHCLHIKHQSSLVGMDKGY